MKKNFPTEWKVPGIRLELLIFFFFFTTIHTSIFLPAFFKIEIWNCSSLFSVRGPKPPEYRPLHKIIVHRSSGGQRRLKKKKSYFSPLLVFNKFMSFAKNKFYSFISKSSLIKKRFLSFFFKQRQSEEGEDWAGRGSEVECLGNVRNKIQKRNYWNKNWILVLQWVLLLCLFRSQCGRSIRTS